MKSKLFKPEVMLHRDFFKNFAEIYLECSKKKWNKHSGYSDSKEETIEMVAQTIERDRKGSRWRNVEKLYAELTFKGRYVVNSIRIIFAHSGTCRHSNELHKIAQGTYPGSLSAYASLEGRLAPRIFLSLTAFFLIKQQMLIKKYLKISSD